MPELEIDNQSVRVPEGSTILDAARKLGIDIPTLCFLKGHSPRTSCMVCLVKVKGEDRFLPSCAAKAADGMQVESESDEVRLMRRAALELLLSDHLGDCLTPCHVACPAQMNIPVMIRQIAAGSLADAIATVKERIALPAVLGRICPAPCEKACRRGQGDASVGICLLKRYVADVDLAREVPFLPPRQAESGKKVAIVGAGPTGLAAAYYLLQQGHACTVFDEHDEPGGMLRYGIPASALPRDVLDAEIAIIKKLGAEFRMQTKIGEKIPVGGLQDEFDAVFLAIGEIKGGSANAIGLKVTARGIEADARTYETALGGIFAGGSAVRPSKLAVRAVAEGHAAATAIGQYLSGASVTGSRRPFSTHIGRLQEGEMEIFMADASEAERVVPAGGDDAGFSDQEARLEAARCLHCDCRKAEACKLRQYSEAYEAGRSRYKGQRKLFQQDCRHPDIIYEPGKCVVCGMCIRIADSAREPLGLTFIGRGFDVKVGVPFNHSIAEGLRDVAAQCAAACPTGALAMKDSSPSEPQEARAEEPA